MFVWTFGQASLVTLLAFCYVFVVLDEARHLHNYREWERRRGFPLPLIIEKQYNFAFVLNFFGGVFFHLYCCLYCGQKRHGNVEAIQSCS